VRVEVGGSRDLRKIASGFNRMVDSLSRTLRELDARARELAAMHTAAARFVPFQFLGLLHKPSLREVERGDQTELDMTVLFSDIRGFTRIAERMGPEQTFTFINRYLAEMEVEIHREQGFINDFFGDGIMALFHTGADAGVRAALGMLAAVERLNGALVAEGRDAIALMLGTIGGRDRLSCSVVGDPANTAARVEGMTKLYGATLLIGEATLRRLDDPARYRLREVDRVQAVGKAEPLSIYEILDGEPAARREQKLRTCDAFAEAVRAYRSGDFAGAREGFERCRREAPDDAAAALYLERCAALEAQPPPEAWDGVTRLTSK
jgi:class 3 adenylate cyclase